MSVLAGGLALSATGARAAPATPQFGPAIDSLAAYVGQTTCDPTPKPGAIALRDLLEATYPATTPIAIGRDCSIGGTSEHKEGRAYDWGVNAFDPAQKAMATDLLTWLLATDAYGNVNAMARRLGIMYVIWNRQVWKSYGTNRGWQTYTGANPHTDHVHFSLSWDGANARTSWYTAAPKPAAGPTVHVSAAHSGLLLDLPWLGAHGDGVATYFSDGGWDQRWRIVTHPNGEVSFLTHDGNLALEVPGNNAYPGANLRVWAVNGSAAQRFRLEQIEPQEHRIVHPSSGLRLDVHAAGGAGDRLQLWSPVNVANQVFRFLPTVPWKSTIARSAAPTAHVSAAHSGLLLDLPWLGAHGDGVATYFSDGGWDQRWRIVTHPNGEVSFLTHDGNLALEVPGNNAYPGANLRVWAVNGSAAQRFRLEQIEPQEHRIVHPSSGLRLDVHAAGGAGDRLQLWSPVNVANQVFRLILTV